LKATGLEDKVDEGMPQIDEASAGDFVQMCRTLRFWERES